METAPSLAGTWLCSGDETFPAMLAAIDKAQKSVCLEVYIYQGGALGIRFRDALVRAAIRGVDVRLLVDSVGSLMLSRNFFEPLTRVGGQMRWFNPIAFHRVIIRNHRKLLVCDEEIAFVGGFNIAPEYEGDGINCGWCDVGLRIEGRLAVELKASFDEMFLRAEFKHKLFSRIRKTGAKKTVALPRQQLLFSGPGRGLNPFRLALRRDLKRAKDVKIIVAYFLPSWRLRRELARVAKRGGKVQLILAAKSDVAVSMLAARSLYRRMLHGEIEIYEYQPQILHAKMIIVDDVVYVGSSNLDTRSLRINYELMVRFDDAELADEARRIFAGNLEHSRAITMEEWRRTHTIWRSIKQRWAYFLLNRIDPYLARRQWHALPD